MSKANGQIKKEDTYLQHVSLKNYKSIKDVEIDFKPGLNIIIGKNASGKTNFINGLNALLNFNYKELLDSELNIRAWVKKDTIEIQALNKTQNAEDIKNNRYSFSSNHKMSLKINDEQIKVIDYENVAHHLFGKDRFFNEVQIKYGVHYKETSQFINLPSSFVLVNNGKISNELMSIIKDDNRTQFIRTFILGLFYDNILLEYRAEIENGVANQYLKDIIIAISERHLKEINDIVFTYTPIQAIRLNPDFNIIRQDEGQKQTITNFYLEFLIDQSWLTFSLLSDGTKRLFYIISEMLARFNSDDDFIGNDDIRIILLEEPELGIHPHQLHRLMQFIKEQSREKQIILTTHSPQVLDVLESDELDRVIICHSDPKNGTQLSHLSEKEIKKAKKYIQEEAFLSDYWRFSDLEPAS